MSIDTDLTGARVTKKQLLAASRLHGSRFPDGTLYLGEFNLPGDTQDAKAMKVDVEDERALADWYKKSTDEFLRDFYRERPEIDDWK
jgi:hypothetical protein